MKETMIRKIEELMQKEEILEKLHSAGSMENVYALFTENGLEATYEEFYAYLNEIHDKMVEDGMIAEDGELSVELLEMVSGGVNRLVICGVGAVACFADGYAGAGIALVAYGCFYAWCKWGKK